METSIKASLQLVQPLQKYGMFDSRNACQVIVCVSPYHGVSLHSVTENKTVAMAIIELHLSEGISK